MYIHSKNKGLLFGGLLLLILLFSSVIGGVSAAEFNITDSNVIDSDLNNIPLNNISSSVNIICNDPINSSDISCGVSCLISVLNSYNKTVDVNTAIKDINTVNGVTTVAGLANGFNKYGLNCTVIKTNSLEDLKTLCKDNNVIAHMFIKNRYHFAHVIEVKEDGILFNNWFVPFNIFKKHYSDTSIVISNNITFNIDNLSVSVDKSEWDNITGELSEKDLFKYNVGLLDTSLISHSKYINLKENIKDNGIKQGINFLEYVLFGDSLKPKMNNVLIIKKKVTPFINDYEIPIELLRDFNKALTPMQKNLNETISSLDYLSDEIIEFTGSNNLKSLHNPILKHFNYGSSIETITENPVIKDIYDLFITFINCLNPVTWLPDEKKAEWGVKEDHKVFGIYTVYSYNINHNNTTNVTK